MSKLGRDGYHLRGERGRHEVECRERVTCFLCLKLVRPPHPPSDCDGDKMPKEDFDKQTLLSLFRYLKVDGKDNRQREVSNYEGENVETRKEIWDESEEVASLLLCKGCSIVTGKLINLVEKLELTKVWINHWMKQLVKILSRSTSGPKSRKKRGRPRSGDLTIRLLRTQTKKNCISRLQKTDFPLVRLERLPNHDNSLKSEMHPKLNLPIPTDFIKQELKVEVFEEQKMDEKMLEEMTQPVEEEKSSDDIDIHVGPTVQVKVESSTLTYNDFETSLIPVIIACPFCDETVSSNSGLNRHTAAVHPEQFLSSSKSSDVSEQEFKSMCQNFLRHQCQLKIIDKKFGCLYCPVTRTFGNRLFLKVHLINSHRSILLKKLELFQNGIEETNETKYFSTATSSPKPKSFVKSLLPQPLRNFICRYCNKRCVTHWSLKKHTWLVHRFSTTKPVIAKTTKNRKSAFKAHQKHDWAVTQKKIESPQERKRKLKASKNQDIPPDVVSWQCIECDQSFVTLDELESHSTMLPSCSNKLDDLPGPSIQCCECEATFNHRNTFYRHRKKCHPSNLGSNTGYVKLRPPKILPCPYCERPLANWNSLKQHFKRFCHSIPESQRKLYTSTSESTGFNQINDSKINKKEPLVVPGNDSSAACYNHNEDNNEGGMIIPDYDPLM